MSLSDLWPSMLIGTTLLVVATSAGWSFGRHRALPPVRLVAWWVRFVVAPLVRSRSWFRRSATIFVNNTAVLAAVVALGPWVAFAYAGVIALGLSLGIGLRVLARLDGDLAIAVGPSGTTQWTLVVGVALNLLEPPAIIIALGLSLGRQSVPLDSAWTWSIFAKWLVPLLILAAVGEGLWLGAGRRDRPPTDPA